MTTVVLDQVTINGSVYYSANQLKEHIPSYFYGCMKCPKKIVERRKIPYDQYVFASYNKKTGYTLYEDVVPTKAVLYIKKKWVDTYIIKDKNDVTINCVPDVVSETQSSEDYVEAPALLYIEDECKFRDEEGDVINIETRGERTPSGIYFLASDVATGFDIIYLQDIIKDKGSSYVCGEDYAYFLSKDTMNRVHRVMYLTYEGIVRVLILTRSSKTRHFTKWATNVLFTVQMGTIEKKEDLAASMIGVGVKSLRTVLSTSTGSVPCIYMFFLGKCGVLREAMNISNSVPDDHIIIKYGYTNDLSRRSFEHASTYGTIRGACVELLKFVYIDPKFLSEAEVTLKSQLLTQGVSVEYRDYKELVAVNYKNKKTLDELFEMIGSRYSGNISNLLSIIKKHEEQALLTEEKHEKELLVERHKVETLELKYESQVREQAMEIKYLKMMLSMKKDDNVDRLEDCLSNIKL